MIDVVDVIGGTFVFQGTNVFSGTQAEVRYVQTAGSTIIEVDSTGNGAVDMEIELAGLYTLTGGDFVL